MYPANFDHVIGVGSVNEIANQRETYSNYGESLDFVISGTNIFSANHNNSYSRLTGTSQSTAILTGIIARLKAYDHRLNVADITSILKRNTTQPLQKNNQLGHGTPKIDGLMADFNIHTNSYSISNSPHLNTADSVANQLTSVMVVPNPITTATAQFQVNSSTTGLAISITIYNLDGTKINKQDFNTQAGLNLLSMNVGSLKNGVYFYVIENTTSDETHVGKCVISR